MSNHRWCLAWRCGSYLIARVVEKGRHSPFPYKGRCRVRSRSFVIGRMENLRIEHDTHVNYVRQGKKRRYYLPR